MRKPSLTVISFGVVVASIPIFSGSFEAMAQARSRESRPSDPAGRVSASSIAPRTTRTLRDAWTPELIRATVIHIEAAMEELQALEAPPVRHGKPIPIAGTCHGEPLTSVIERSFAMSRARDLLSGKALSCYVANYLGCPVGPWIGKSASSYYTPEMKAFTRSKVTIVEQTEDRVVADVVEADTEQIYNDVLGEWDDANSKYVEFPDEVLARYTNVSRYTLTRAGYVWRISDRKSPFKWECR